MSGTPDRRRRCRSAPRPDGPPASGPSRRAVLGGLAALAAVPSLAHAAPGAAVAAGATRQIAESFWRAGELAAGSGSGTVAGADGVRLATPLTRRPYTDPGNPAAATVTYDAGTWDSPVITPGFGWTELVASWNADTPPGTWVEVNVRGFTASGTPTGWFVLGRWCARDVADGGAIQRTSVAGQAFGEASVATDTLVVGDPALFASWQLRVVLLRRAGTTATPTLRLAGAVATAVPSAGSTAEPTSAFGGYVGTLAVPTYSQELHAGHYTAWGGGGESWCSATTTAMILDYWGAGPSVAERAWVSPAVDGQVDYAARQVYDAAYGGTGNWPFNTAYAATRRSNGGPPLEGYVTRLRDLAAAEPYLRAGVPLGVSLSFTAAELSGAGYGTDGHLMVLLGFDRAGNPVVNDPASHLVADDARVRTTYRRDQFERAWANSGRTAYVVRPGAPPPPPAPVRTLGPAPDYSGPAVPITPVGGAGARSIPRRR